MQTRNSMKSVLAQGATVVKAIEEALKKADMPQEFFVKILEEAQSGFLGFGSKKAKIALFFRKESFEQRGEGILAQASYENLFNNQAMQKQIENQQRDVPSQKDVKPAPSAPVAPRPQTVARPQAQTQTTTRRPNQFQQRELRQVNPQVKENQEQSKENQPQVRTQQVRPLEKTDSPQRPQRRLQDIPQRQLPRRELPRRDQSRSDESNRDEMHRDEPRREQSRRDEPRRHEPRRDDSRRDDSRRDDSRRDDNFSSEQSGQERSDLNQSGQERSQRPNYPNRRRPRDYSPRPRQTDGDGERLTSSTPKNNNDSDDNS